MNFICITNNLEIHIQYWCIDGKYKSYMAMLRNGGKTRFSGSFHPFRAGHISYLVDLKKK